MPTVLNGSIYLTPTDRANLKCLGWGFSDKQIAAHRGVTRDTVKQQMHELRAKFNVENRVQLVLNALKLGYLQINSYHNPLD